MASWYWLIVIGGDSSGMLTRVSGIIGEVKRTDMNAAEARVKAHNVKLEAYKDQYEQVVKIISSAASAGRYEVTYYEPITPSVKQRLGIEGYTLKEKETNIGEAVIISW